MNNTEHDENDLRQEGANNENFNNDMLNEEITHDEIITCIKNLKNGKCAGIDNIKNEYINFSSSLVIQVYVKLFNLILDSGNIPESLLIGIIKPLYKNKGDPLMAENYRPITIVRCMGKLFTAILNSRLNTFIEENGILNENQCGFRANYSTSDNIFVIHCIIECLRVRKLKTFYAFIDFQKAFDSVWRVGLWSKLLSINITGKIFNIIKNMYKDIKSCVSHIMEKRQPFCMQKRCKAG